jgi:hypothetical protein
MVDSILPESAARGLRILTVGVLLALNIIILGIILLQVGVTL